MLYRDGLHDDTEAIQAKLDECGCVTIEGGIYLISKPLIVHSNTALSLAPDAVMMLADGANCAIIENDALEFKGMAELDEARNDDRCPEDDGQERGDAVRLKQEHQGEREHQKAEQQVRREEGEQAAAEVQHQEAYARDDEHAYEDIAHKLC